MKSCKVLALVCGSAFLFSTVPVFAVDDALLTLGVGAWHFSPNHDDQKLEGRLEYRGSGGLFETDSFTGLKPLLGVMVNTEESVFGYAGFAVPFRTGSWELTPSAGVGAYSRGRGRDLGGTFQFHLGLSLTYPVSQRSRLGVALAHISNAGIHDFNPGVNSLFLTWSLAL